MPCAEHTAHVQVLHYSAHLDEQQRALPTALVQSGIAGGVLGLRQGQHATRQQACPSLRHLTRLVVIVTAHRRLAILAVAHAPEAPTHLRGAGSMWRVINMWFGEQALRCVAINMPYELRSKSGTAATHQLPDAASRMTLPDAARCCPMLHAPLAAQTRWAGALAAPSRSPPPPVTQQPFTATSSAACDHSRSSPSGTNSSSTCASPPARAAVCCPALRV